MEFLIPGVPISKGRPRFSNFGKHTRVYTPKKTVSFEKKIALLAFQQGVTRLEGPVSVEISFVFNAKRKGRLPKATKPDIDNLAKAVLDGLNGVAYADDGQVTELWAKKIHAAKDEAAHTLVRVKPWSNEDA